MKLVFETPNFKFTIEAESDQIKLSPSIFPSPDENKTGNGVSSDARAITNIESLGRMIQGKICPGCRKEIKKANRHVRRFEGVLWHRKCHLSSKKKPSSEDDAEIPMDITARFKKYFHENGGSPVCAECNDLIGSPTAAIHVSGEWFHALCFNKRGEVD